MLKFLKKKKADDLEDVPAPPPGLRRKQEEIPRPGANKQSIQDEIPVPDHPKVLEDEVPQPDSISHKADEILGPDNTDSIPDPVPDPVQAEKSAEQPSYDSKADSVEHKDETDSSHPVQETPKSLDSVEYESVVRKAKVQDSDGQVDAEQHEMPDQNVSKPVEHAIPEPDMAMRDKLDVGKISEQEQEDGPEYDPKHIVGIDIEKKPSKIRPGEYMKPESYINVHELKKRWAEEPKAMPYAPPITKTEKEEENQDSDISDSSPEIQDVTEESMPDDAAQDIQPLSDDFKLPDFDDTEFQSDGAADVEPVGAELAEVESVPRSVQSDSDDIFVRAYQYIAIMNGKKQASAMLSKAYAETDNMIKENANQEPALEAWYDGMNLLQEDLIKVDQKLFSGGEDE